MPNIDDLMPKTSKYMAKEDLPQPRMITIASVHVENVAMQGQPEENKVIVTVQEADLKPLVLNVTNKDTLKALYGPMTENWIGQQLVAWNDLSVHFQGKVGGIRLRLPDNVAMQPAAQAPQTPSQGFQQPAGQVPGSQPVIASADRLGVQQANPGLTSQNVAPNPSANSQDMAPDEDIPW